MHVICTAPLCARRFSRLRAGRGRTRARTKAAPRGQGQPQRRAQEHPSGAFSPRRRHQQRAPRRVWCGAVPRWALRAGERRRRGATPMVLLGDGRQHKDYESTRRDWRRRRTRPPSTAPRRPAVRRAPRLIRQHGARKRLPPSTTRGPASAPASLRRRLRRRWVDSPAWCRHPSNPRQGPFGSAPVQRGAVTPDLSPHRICAAACGESLPAGWPPRRQLGARQRRWRAVGSARRRCSAGVAACASAANARTPLVLQGTMSPRSPHLVHVLVSRRSAVRPASGRPPSWGGRGRRGSGDSAGSSVRSAPPIRMDLLAARGLLCAQAML